MPAADHHQAMVTMWTAMAAAFGSAWLSQYGTSEEPAFQIWLRDLEQYTPEQIQRGTRNVTDPKLWDNDFPPNLAQFKKLCLTEQRYAAGYHRPFSQKQLGYERRRASRETVAREKEIQRHIIASGFEASRDDACRALGFPVEPREQELQL